MNSTPMHSQRHERKALKKQEKLLLQRTEFEELFSLQNLHKAFLKAKKKKRLKPEVYDFSQNIVENLLNIQKEIFESIYKFGPYRTFVKFDSKKRYVVASPFKDRIVHWVIYDYLYEIFDKSFIYDSFGNRKGKGTLKGMQRAWKFMRNKNSNIILKIDLSKYFYSIHHSVLKKALRRKVKNKYMLQLIFNLIDSYVTPEGMFDHIFSKNSPYFKSKRKGMPIGSLDSQIFANIYVDFLDFHIKHTIKVKKYIRYVDDMVFFLDNKKDASAIFRHIVDFCDDELLIEINPRKIAFIPKNKHIDFLGYRTYEYKVLPRKSTQKKIRRALQINNNVSLDSYSGILKHTNSHLKNVCNTAINMAKAV